MVIEWVEGNAKYLYSEKAKKDRRYELIWKRDDKSSMVLCFPSREKMIEFVDNAHYMLFQIVEKESCNL